MASVPRLAASGLPLLSLRHLPYHLWNASMRVKVIGIDTNIEVIVVSLTTWEAHHSPRAKPKGCGELPRSLMRQQWPKLRYQFLFYHDETKLMLNKQILSIEILQFVPKLPWLQHGYMCTSWGHVTWLFLLGNRCSNHCDVTVRIVTLNSNCTLNQNGQQNIENLNTLKSLFLGNRSKLIKMFW